MTDRDRFIWKEGDLVLVKGVPMDHPFIRVKVARGWGQLVYKVTDLSGDFDPFYLWREGDSLLLAYEPFATVDLRVLIQEEDWDAEYGALIEYADLLRLVEEAGRT